MTEEAIPMNWDEPCYEYVVNPAVELAAELIDTVYEYSGVGGNCHIVTDDYNIEDEYIHWCLDVALKDNIHEADEGQLAAEKACLEQLLKLTEDERWSAIQLASRG